MKKNDLLHQWYKKPVTPYLFFMAMILLSAASLFQTELGGSMPSAEKNFSIITQHYGISSEEIERTITVPLEESISVIAGIEQLRSSSEYSKSRVDIILNKETDGTDFYLNLRDRIETVYSNMPQSVQKPQIVTSGSNQKPSFIISFSSDVTDPIHLRPFIENEVKPSYEKIPGIGEIEVGGGALKEIHVELNEEKLTLAGHNPGTIASMIQKQNQYSPLGKIKHSSVHIPVSIDGRLTELNEIKKLMITTRSGQDIELQDLAEVRFGYRKPESVSRVEGAEKVTLYIKTGGESNVVELSQKLNIISERWIDKGLDVNIIYDQGLQMKESIKQVIIAILIGMIVVALFITIALRNLKQAFILSLSLPITGVVTIAILNFFNIPVDNYILAGMAIAVGIIIDSGIIISESKTENNRNIGRILPALASSTLTSVIVLFPLIHLRDSIRGIGPISITLLIMLLLSLVLNVLFVPIFFKYKSRVPYQPHLFLNMKNHLLGASKFAFEKWIIIILFTIILIVAAIFSLISGGSKFDTILEEPLIFAHVEMESGASVASVDGRIKDFIPILKEHPQINQVESISRRGNAQLTIRYGKKDTDTEQLKSWIKTVSASIPRASLFIPEESTAKTVKIEIAITGTDNNRLRSLARETLNDFMDKKWIIEGILHFKDPPPSYTLWIDQTQYPISGLSSQDIVDRFRWDLQGPVADKWLEDGDEMDLRVMGSGNRERTYKELQSLPFASARAENAYIRADQLGDFREDTEPSRIYRNNKQRCVYFSVKTKSMNLDKLEKAVWSVLDKQNIPDGYAFQLDRKIYKQKDQLKRLWLLFLLALFLIYAVLSAQSESFTSPVIILAFIPISLSFPVIALRVINQSISTSIIIGFIVLTGMVVNNAILIIDYCRNKQGPPMKILIIEAIGTRLKPLLLTSGTTALGTLPLLFNNPGEFSFLNALSFIMLFGIIGSIFASLLFIPAMAKLWPGGFKSLKLN